MRMISSKGLDKGFYEYKMIEDVSTVRELMMDVRLHGDDAVRRATRRFDNVELSDIRVPPNDIKDAYGHVDEAFTSSLKKAADNIRKFAKRQMDQFKDFELEVSPGVLAGQRVAPIRRVGIYVPGGRFPLVSSLLMCAVPAKVAGVKEIAVCSPPLHNGTIHPTILVAADILGVNDIFKVGGVQAIAAMAFGTETVGKVDKIVGPGNRFVAMAKREAYGRVGIDLVAGPTEVMIIADDSARPETVAADLLAQAEHDPDAVPILITTSRVLADRMNATVDLQLADLKTKSIAGASIAKNGLIIIADGIEEAIEIANKKAPEHLVLHVSGAEKFAGKCRNYGSLFIGDYSTEALGDYSSGLNHTLPTNTSARYTGGLSVKDFLRLQTTLKVNEKGFMDIGPVAKVLADAEGLVGHARSVQIRLDKLKQKKR